MAQASLPKAKTKKSDLLEKQKEQQQIPNYTDEQKEYLKALQKRLEGARDLRDQPHEEFDNLPFIPYWQAIERSANTTIQAKKNKGETTFQSGTLRTKMLAFLATYQGLNLKVDISAYNEYEVIINNLGNAMEDILEKIDELNEDEELRMLRQYEMLKHGYVFVESIWKDEFSINKKLKNPFDGKVTGCEWTTESKKGLGKPVRNIISGLGVYLGDLTKYFIKDQPYIFTVEVINYSEAEASYKNWEMWKYVTKDLRKFSGSTAEAITENAWRLLGEAKKGKVEVIKYQDKPHNEFQILLNGIPMLPIGFPLTEISPDGEYTITQQNLEPIRYNFAYGKSFIFKNKNIVAVLDQMMKLGVLKTQQSFVPPLLNFTSKLISRDIFMPGQMTRGISKGDIGPVIDWTPVGVTTSEFNMIQEVIKWIDRNTVSQTATGAKEEGGKVTATQIVQLQRQARIMMGLMILAAGLLEKKLAQRSVPLVVSKWFDPVDTTVDEIKNEIVGRYRRVTRKKIIEGEGMGMRMIIPTEEVQSPIEIKALEEEKKKETGMPHKIIQINPIEFKKMKLIWVYTVNLKEKRSSEYSKILFTSMVQDARALGLAIDPSWTEERFAQVWEEDPNKMFSKGAQALAMRPEEIKPRVKSPEIKMPASEREEPAVATR